MATSWRLADLRPVPYRSCPRVVAHESSLQCGTEPATRAKFLSWLYPDLVIRGRRLEYPRRIPLLCQPPAARTATSSTTPAGTNSPLRCASQMPCTVRSPKSAMCSGDTCCHPKDPPPPGSLYTLFSPSCNGPGLRPLQLRRSHEDMVEPSKTTRRPPSCSTNRPGRGILRGVPAPGFESKLKASSMP